MKKVVVLGGGTGTFVVLSGLKKYDFNLAVIVTMMDSGGSTGRLRDQLGVLPPGDLRQSLVALSDAPGLWRKLFLYRFERGDLAGHNFGNIFLSALEKVTANYDEVIDTASYVLKTQGRVIPVTFKKTHLDAQYENGKVVHTEGNIDTNLKETSRVKKAYLEPQVDPNPKAIEAIKDADYLVIGPGDLYTSIIPVLLVSNMKETILNSKAKIIYNMNLMTKAGQTFNYSALDHLNDLAKYLSKKPDFVLINNKEIPRPIVDWYSQWNEHIVKNDLQSSNYSGTLITEEFIDTVVYEQSAADKLMRSILRHNPDKLAKVLNKIMI